MILFAKLSHEACSEAGINFEKKVKTKKFNSFYQVEQQTLISLVLSEAFLFLAAFLLQFSLN